VSVRVRFAPSPTGSLHVGTARTVLYNWLFARRHDGTLVVRVDDTDAERSTAEFEQDILESVHWLGMDWDEGVDIGGPHEPYRQRLRLDRYREVADRLVAEGAAYYDLATAEQLDELRRKANAAGLSPVYDGRFRASAEEAAERIAAGERLPVRFAVSRPGETSFEDAIRGEVRFDHADIDDFILLRSDGSPTYHLASTVDDIDFRISHVIRGEDLLPSTPKHILLTAAIGGAEPIYAHISLLTGPDGSKLSKRHGATSLREYREAGILPEAMCNYLAILGWSPGEDEEVVPLATMVERFELSALSKNPAVFDATKLEWMNGVYLRGLEASDFVGRTLPLVEQDLGRALDEAERDRFCTIAPLVQERARRLTEVAGQVRFLFAETEMDPASWEKVMRQPEVRSILESACRILEGVEDWAAVAIEEALRGMLAEMGLSARQGLQPLRVAASGSMVSPPLFE
jgi:glutamyl-tRNA synthetase